MKYSLPLIGMLLLTGCATTGSSVDAICSIPKPVITAEHAAQMPTPVLIELDLYFERVRKGCQ